MEREKVINYLKGYYYAGREIRQITEELKAISYEFGLKSPALSGMPSGSCDGSDLSRYIIRVETIQRQLEEKREKQVMRMGSISDVISTLSDPEERLILRYRYLILDHGRLQTWERIADNCYMSRRTVIRAHDSGVEKLARNGTIECDNV